MTSAQNAGTECTKPLPDGHTEYWGNSYSYDAWGNLQKTPTKCSAENLRVRAKANNQLQGGYTYDIAGNMMHEANLDYVYDQENRITGAAPFTYTYDADGNRVEKSNGTTGTLYWYMTPGIVAESDLAGNLKSEYIFFDGERVARKDFPGNAVSYYFSDHLKTASVITDSAGNIKSESDYYPWGGELQFTNNDSNHYKFTGKERDAETGLDYFGARHYSNALGRFITPDWAAKATTVPYADFANPQSLNLYTYVRNIPTTRFDADGHSPEWWQKVWNATKGDGFNTDAQVKENERIEREKKVAWEKRNSGKSYRRHRINMILRTLDLTPMAGFTAPEQVIADVLIAEGKTVTPVVASNTAKSADALVNGVATEFKTLTQAGPNTLKNAIETAAKQGKNIVVDVRNVPISKANAAAQISRAQGNIGSLEGRVTVITSEGKVTF